MHGRACHRYGMHDLRRAYATENADRLPLPTLQKKMQHRGIGTTMRYVETASTMKKTTGVLLPRSECEMPRQPLDTRFSRFEPSVIEFPKQLRLHFINSLLVGQVQQAVNIAREFDGLLVDDGYTFST